MQVTFPFHLHITCLKTIDAITITNFRFDWKIHLTTTVNYTVRIVQLVKGHLSRTMCKSLVTIFNLQNCCLRKRILNLLALYVFKQFTIFTDMLLACGVIIYIVWSNTDCPFKTMPWKSERSIMKRISNVVAAPNSSISCWVIRKYTRKNILASTFFFFL